MKQRNETKLSDIKVPCGGKLVYYLLSVNADKRSEVSIPIAVMADKLGIATSTVVKNIERLRKAGVIYVQPQYLSDGMRTTNIYRIKEYK